MTNLLALLRNHGPLEATATLGLIIWDILEPNPGPNAERRYVFLLVILVIWITHTLYSTLRRHNWRTGIESLLVAVAGIFLFLIPYQGPTAHPLGIDIRGEARGTNTWIHASFLHDYPDEDFAIPVVDVTNSGLVRQHSSTYHVHIENRSFVFIGPLSVSLRIVPPENSLIYYLAVALPGALRSYDDRYYYILSDLEPESWLTYDERCLRRTPALSVLADLPPGSWCLFQAPFPGSQRPIILGLPKLRQHSSYDIYFEVAGEKMARRKCALKVEITAQSIGIDLATSSIGDLSLDEEVCK